MWWGWTCLSASSTTWAMGWTVCCRRASETSRASRCDFYWACCVRHGQPCPTNASFYRGPTISARTAKIYPPAHPQPSICASEPTSTQVLRLGTASSAAPNNIVGTTPSTICQMAALEDLYLRYVFGMQGSVPTCIGDLTKLKSIDYTYAGTLSGTLPRGLCSLTNLEWLGFQFTYGLSGTIPDCLGENHKRLSAIWLEGNELTGTIPQSLCLLGDSLSFLSLGDNDLTGNCVGLYGPWGWSVEEDKCAGLHQTCPCR